MTATTMEPTTAPATIPPIGTEGLAGAEGTEEEDGDEDDKDD